MRHSEQFAQSVGSRTLGGISLNFYCQTLLSFTSVASNDSGLDTTSLIDLDWRRVRGRDYFWCDLQLHMSHWFRSRTDPDVDFDVGTINPYFPTIPIINAKVTVCLPVTFSRVNRWFDLDDIYYRHSYHLEWYLGCFSSLTIIIYNLLRKNFRKINSIGFNLMLKSLNFWEWSIPI